MKMEYKKITAGAVTAAAACMAIGFSVMAAKEEASVVRGEYDFNNMEIRRVWLNADDPVFMVDDYDRVWLDANVNAVGLNDSGKSYDNLLVPMKEMFRQIGGEYTENGDQITIKLNGDTLELTVGSRDTVFNGEKKNNALKEQQVPQRINMQENDYNTFLDEEYSVTYLPAHYILEMFQADMGEDSSVASLYAAIPIFKGDKVPFLKTAAKGYGIRFDELLNKTAKMSEIVVSNLIGIQNADGGFSILPDNTDMEQEDLAAHRGTLTGESTLEKGTTTALLMYLADAVESGYLEAETALTKGVQYFITYQNKTGGWQMNPSDPKGFRSNIIFTDHATTDVLRLLRRVNTDEDLKGVKGAVGESRIAAAIKKGDAFILDTQLSFDERLSGWASQYKENLEPTMGRTYERESVSAIETADITDYLMDYYTADDAEVKRAVDAAVEWLADVKIEDKEAVIIQDYTMQNGYDIFLLGEDEPGVKDTSYADDGLGTWAANYKYTNGEFKPLYSDVDPERPDQKMVNDWNATSSRDLIWYATRTEVTYFNNDLADELPEEYEAWKQGVKPDEPEDPGYEEDSNDSEHTEIEMSGPSQSLKGNWSEDDKGWKFIKTNGSTAQSEWGIQNGVWYYFGTDGYACTGWQQIGGIWYYLDLVSCAMHVEWQQIPESNTWYYLDPQTGAMRTGWVKIADKWYYFNPVSSNGEAGKMPLGELYQNTTTPDGYIVDANGAWVQ